MVCRLSLQAMHFEYLCHICKQGYAYLKEWSKAKQATRQLWNVTWILVSYIINLMGIVMTLILLFIGLSLVWSIISRSRLLGSWVDDNTNVSLSFQWSFFLYFPWFSHLVTCHFLCLCSPVLLFTILMLERSNNLDEGLIHMMLTDKTWLALSNCYYQCD